jgi:hypothetical protein
MEWRDNGWPALKSKGRERKSEGEIIGRRGAAVLRPSNISFPASSGLGTDSRFDFMHYASRIRVGAVFRKR